MISSKTRCTSKCRYTWDPSSLDFRFLLKTASKHIKHQINKMTKVKFTKMSFHRNAYYSKTMKELELINTDAETVVWQYLENKKQDWHFKMFQAIANYNHAKKFLVDIGTFFSTKNLVNPYHIHFGWKYNNIKRSKELQPFGKTVNHFVINYTTMKARQYRNISVSLIKK